MAIYLPEKKALFVHIPKTGGHWVASALQFHKIPHRPAKTVVEHLHATPAQCLEDVEFTFCFVRHPVRWYESWWKYMCGRWGGLTGSPHPVEPIVDCRCDEFDHFVQQCLVVSPGFVSRMYETYMPVDFVGKLESISTDLKSVLRQLGYDVPDLTAVPKAHVSESKLGEPVWNSALRGQVEQMEAAAIQRYYT